MLTLFILPVSTIMYASGSTEGGDESSDGGSTEGGDESSDGGSTDNSGGGSTSDDSGSPENSVTLPAESAVSNNTENVPSGDLANSVLAVHNEERAAVGVPPLTWSDTLAAGAQTWAQQIVTTGEFDHDPNRPNDVGENIASFTPSTPAYGSVLWVKRKG